MQHWINEFIGHNWQVELLDCGKIADAIIIIYHLVNLVLKPDIRITT